MAGAREHIHVVSVISARQAPAFTQLRSRNPCLAVLFSDRLGLNSPQTHFFSEPAALRQQNETAEVRWKELCKEKEEMSKVNSRGREGLRRVQMSWGNTCCARRWTVSSFLKISVNFSLSSLHVDVLPLLLKTVYPALGASWEAIWTFSKKIRSTRCIATWRDKTRNFLSIWTVAMSLPSHTLKFMSNRNSTWYRCTARLGILGWYIATSIGCAEVKFCTIIHAPLMVNLLWFWWSSHFFLWHSEVEICTCVSSFNETSNILLNACYLVLGESSWQNMRSFVLMQLFSVLNALTDSLPYPPSPPCSLEELWRIYLCYCMHEIYRVLL